MDGCSDGDIDNEEKTNTRAQDERLDRLWEETAARESWASVCRKEGGQRDACFFFCHELSSTLWVTFVL